MGKQKEKHKRIAKKKRAKYQRGIAKVASMENVDLLSKEQIKKIVANPTTATGVSGKRKNRMIKRLRHINKKQSIDAEMEDVQTKKSKKVGKVKKRTDAMDVE